MSDDPRLSQRYRELPREEPPRALDEAILAASRRAVQRRRWYIPLATAAVLALAVAVTLHVQRDRPAEEVDAVSPKAEAPPARPAPAAREERKERKQVGELAAQRGAARAMIDNPEAQLERIARLRAAGRHEEADKALAEFRKRYPDYRLSEEMKAKVERQ